MHFYSTVTMFPSFSVQNHRYTIAKFSLQAKTQPFSSLIMKKKTIK